MIRSRVIVSIIGAVLLVSYPPVVAADDGPAPAGEALAQAIERLLDAVETTIEREGELDPTADSEPALAKVVRAGRRSSGAVALTFDDGFNSEACARITNTLRKHDAVGTFFINGNWLKSEPAKWRRILDGMPVGNHTRSHRDLTREVHPIVIKQIKENEAIHERVLERPMLKVLRPSYGAYGERVQRIAAQLGYESLVLWNVDTNDWKGSSSARSIVRRATGARSGSIILMHCSSDATAKALPEIIRHYRKRGIALAALDEVLRP